MSNEVAAALVLTGGTIVAAVIALWGERKKGKQQEQQHEELVKEVADKAATDTAYTVDVDQLVVKFADDGSGEYRWARRGIQAKQDIQNLRISFEWEVACPGGKLLRPSAQAVRDVDPPVTLEVAELTDTRSRGQVTVNGFLSPEGDQASILLVQPFQKAFCMSKSEAERAYKNDPWTTEYVTSSSTVPVRLLEVTVEFPASHRTLAQKPKVVVFYPKTERMHAAEAQRVSQRLVVTEGRATLTVERPIVGVRYGLSWMPPAS